MLSCLCTPAYAQDSNIDLNLGGYFRGYMTHVEQDNGTGLSERHVDIVRDSEIHLKGETKLDNGLKLGMQFEFAIDRGDDFGVDKSFLYVAGDWGRIDAGANNGVTYLLQVVAPAADSNYDGMRQYVRTVNYVAAPAAFTGLAAFDLEYAQDTTASSDKISYQTPLIQGFQAGVSYTPDVQATSFVGNQESTTGSRGLAGVATDDVAGAYGSGWDMAAHYETDLHDVKLTLGAGYIFIEHEKAAVGEDDLHAWNSAAALKYKNLGVGVSYSENDNGTRPDKDSEVLVVGADYKINDWKLGASWYMRDDNNFSGTATLDTERYSAGAVYTYGPGMTLRGSVHYIDHDVGTANMDATSFLLGTQVNF